MATDEPSATEEDHATATDGASATGRTAGAKNDDLRELLAMIAVLVGSRVQRDVDGRNDVDPEADVLLAEMRDKLRALLVRREEAAEPKAFYLALVQQLADVYRSVPNVKKPVAPQPDTPEWQAWQKNADTPERQAWQAHCTRVENVLRLIKGASAKKIGECCLSRDQIANPGKFDNPTPHKGGPVEAARAAVAHVLGVGSRTLVHWEQRDKIRPDADDELAPHAPLLYGDTVHFPDAVADVVELLAFDERAFPPITEQSWYVEQLRACDLPSCGKRRLQDDIVLTDEDEPKQ